MLELYLAGSMCSLFISHKSFTTEEKIDIYYYAIGQG
jgi:hypothetical protein